MFTFWSANLDGPKHMKLQCLNSYFKKDKMRPCGMLRATTASTLDFIELVIFELKEVTGPDG